MRNKIILLAFAVFLFTFMVSAIEEGEVYTQQQYDTVNFNTLNLQCEYYGFTAHPLKNRADFNFSCLSAKPIENDNYLVFRRYKEYPIKISDFASCVINHDLTNCIDKFRQMILNMFYNDKARLRKYLASMQTNNLQIDQDDVNFTQEELDSG